MIIRFEGYDENLQNVVFSSKKLKDLGFQYKYSLEDMFVDAVETCREKGLIPLSNESKPNDGPNQRPNTKPEDKPTEKPEDKPNGVEA